MQSSAWTVEGLELIPRGAIDEQQEPLLDLVEGRYAAFVYCAGPREVHTALDVARANGFLERTVLVLGAETWKAADVVAESGVPVILEPPLVHTERDPVTGELTETFVPGVFHEAGVRFALSAANSSSNSLWFQAGRAIGLWTSLTSLATVGGPALGGVIVQTISWRWVFLINVPLAAVTIALALAGRGDDRESHGRSTLDLVGSGLVAVGLVGITYALVTPCRTAPRTRTTSFA